MLQTQIRFHLYGLAAVDAVADAVRGFVDRARRRLSEEGQATAEYALVLIGVAVLALAVMAWAQRSNRPGRLLDAVFDAIIARGK